MHPRGNALHEKLRAALEGRDAKLLREAFGDICSVMTEPEIFQPKCLPYGTPSCISALVICSECALKLGDIDIAEHCNVKYFEHSHQYVQQGEEGCVKPIAIENQWKIRALYIAGILQYEKNKHKKGQKLRDSVLSALQNIVDGITAARKSNRYKFLVYNGSIHFWQIGRCLMKEGVRFMLQPLGKVVVDALADLPEGKEDWKASCLVNYSLCLQEIGKLDEAIQVVTEACQCVTKSTNVGLKSLTLGLKTHLLQKAGKISDKDKKTGDEESEALILLQAVKSSKLSPEETEKSLNELLEKVKGSEAANDFVANIGWVAYTQGAMGIAESSALVAKENAKDPLARLRADLTLQALELHQADPGKAHRKNVEAISKFDETLSSLIRIGDASAIQDCCILIWNAGLVLQKPTSRKFIMHPFSNAVSILDKMGSPLVKLRVQFHLELTKGSLENNYLSNAAKHADKGYHLYETFLNKGQGDKGNGSQTTLAKTITELKKIVDMKSNKQVDKIDPYAADKELDYGKLGDCVIQAVENALNAKSQVEKEEILTEAMHLVDNATRSQAEAEDAKPESSEEAEEGEDAEGSQEEAQEEKELQPEEIDLMQKQVVLWGHIVQSAWAAKLDKIVRNAAMHVFPEFRFQKETHPEAIKVQISASYADAESCMFTLHNKGLRLDPPVGTNPIDANPGKPPEEIATDDDLLVRACSQFIRGVKLSISLGNYTRALNGAIYIWNAFSSYIDITSGEEYDKIVPIMSVLLKQLLKIPRDKQDKELLCKICNTLACGLEHKVLISWSTSSSRSYQVLLIELSKHKTLNLSDQDTKLVEEALESCESVISMLGEDCDSLLFATCARLVRLSGKSPTVKPGQAFESTRENISFVVHVIEQTQNKILVGRTRKEALKDAIKAVTKLKKPFYDLLVQIARVSLEMNETHAAIESSEECLKMLELANIKDGSVKQTDRTKYEWYIASACEMMGGEASLQVRQLDKQERSVQLHIYKIAGDKFLKAVKYAYYANHQDMVLRAGRLFWNSVLSLMNNPEERRLIVESLEEMFSYIDSSAIYSKDRNLCVLVVRALLESYTEEGSWDQGLKRLTAAFRILPQSEHLSLWKTRTYLLINAGLNPMNDDVKDHSEDIKAELWLIVARNSYNREDQYSAYLEACNCFPQDPIKSAKYWLTLAEWLLEQSVPQGDITHVLNKASSLLLTATSSKAAPSADKIICRTGEPDIFLEGCSICQISVLLHLFVLKMQVVATYKERHYMAMCATACCKYLMLNGFHASCVRGNSTSESTFPHKWDEWVKTFLEEDAPRDWIVCVQEELLYKGSAIYKDLKSLADALFEMKDYGYGLKVSWLLVLVEEALGDECETLGYIYASKIFKAAGMPETVKTVEGLIERKLEELKNRNLPAADLIAQEDEGIQSWSPVLTFLAYVEHYMSRDMFSFAAKLLMFVKEKFNVADSATSVQLKFYLLAAKIEVSFNRFESAALNLAKVRDVGKVRGSLKFWKDYIALYIDVKLGQGQVSQQLHTDLENVRSILQMVSDNRSNTIASYETKETLAQLYRRDAELYFLEASEMEKSRRSADKAKQKYFEAFSMLDCACEALKETGSPLYIEVELLHVKALWRKAKEDKSKDILQLIVELLSNSEKQLIEILQCKLGHADSKDVNGVHSRANGFMPYFRNLGEIRAILGVARLQIDVLTENYNDGKWDHLPSFPKVDGKDAACVEEFLSENLGSVAGRAIMATSELAGLLADDSYQLCAEITKYRALALSLFGLSMAHKTKDGESPLGSQAISALQASFKLSIKANDMETALSTAESLMGLYLRADRAMDASLQLFLIQSCKFSLQVPRIVENACDSADKYRLLLQSREKMVRDLLLPYESEVFKKVDKQLNSMDEVVSHLNMNLPRAEITKSLPEDTVFVSFHIGKGIHDPFEDSHLYVACMKKGKDGGEDVEAQVERMAYEKKDWDRFFGMLSLWKAKSSKFLKDNHVYVDKEMQKPAQEAGSGSGSENEAPEDPTIPKSYHVNAREILTEGWKEVLSEAGALLEPLMGTVRAALGIKGKGASEAVEEEGGEEGGADAKEAEADAAPEQIPLNICLCVDAALSMIPFEALDEFSQCVSVSRNPCLISFCLLNQQLEASSPGGKASVCSKDFNKLKFIVDPKGQFPQGGKEDDEKEGDICHFFENNLQKQFKEWEGIIGRSSMNIGETYIEQVYDNCVSLMCITPGRFSHVFTPKAIKHTNLKNCRMGFLFDQCISENAFLEEKNLRQRQVLEDHYDVSTFLMLQGVKSVVVNSMTTTNLSCCKFIEGFVESLNSGKGLAASVKESGSLLQAVPDLPPHIPFTQVVYGLPNLTIK
ncbi:hypothetical protein HOP50_02g16660 [Chloropicon primus]|uniref:Uncharacterized protein n=2 Tax=Chloropicon primus TaxID=1764295 RepID=A0A5B8MID6_9CHLO|nr:hypothetical protein A3770_02p16700 [Chloropicon primus]UPQ98360.1 hypothetical protein HOP50_02g16660 [Chloropicon primus]|eukprot:QDZ19152.1 hypothetical protein A3770_02p16700 [Chloropicon primus]